MYDRLSTVATFAAYQTTVALGIALLPLAILANRFGVSLPVHRLIDRTETAYRNTR
ncbi:MAG: hypothetical protein ABEJ55_02180 [Halanaeroarchaeum sp.]